MARTFFPEVQALRALAVALVVAFHLQPRLIPGGFIGVDVFFVISGYLITGHLLRERERTGRVRLGAFWAARARRILPAAAVCIVVTLAAAAALSPVTQWARLGADGVAASLSVMNWLLAADAVDYFAPDGAAGPLQHFWSLGVEEQFYLFWPLLVILGGVLSVRGAARGGHQATTVLFVAVTLASFALSVLAVNDPASYFSTFTRVWELAVGGLLAVVVPRLVLAAPARTALSLAGIATILAASLLITRDDPFPGALALAPVLGAAAVIAAGPTAGILAPARVFAARPVQWLGDVSYSLYLWHFPPIVVFSLAAGRAPGWLWSAVLGVLALGLAALSHRLIEQPVRRSAWLSRRPARALGWGAATVAITCTLALILPLAQQRAEAQWLTTAQAAAADGPLGASALTTGMDAAFPTGDPWITPAPTRATQDVPQEIPRTCMSTPTQEVTVSCAGGDAGGSVRVALVGDSHAYQLSTAIFAIGRERGWEVSTHLHASCPFTAAMRELEARGGAVCAGPNAETLALLEAEPPDIVVLADWASGDFVGPGDAGVIGYAETWRRLVAAGIRVVVFTDVPRPLQDPTAVDCVARNYENPEACGVDRAVALEHRDVVARAAALVPEVDVVDVTDRFCGPNVCPAVIGNVLVYRDTNHVTDTYVRTLIPYIGAALPRDLP